MSSQTICPRRADGGPHLPRFPANFIAQMAGKPCSCAYCGKPVNDDGSE